MYAFSFRRADGGLMIPEDEDCLCRKGDTVIQRHLYLSGKNRNTPIFVSGVRTVIDKKDSILFTVTDLKRLEGCDILPSTVQAERKKYHNIVGNSEPMKKLFRQIELAADSDVSVLILGESGTGKELVASAIHSESLRRKEPFIRVNCSSLVENLLESELFGHVKGSFTGAVNDRKGKFEAANGGTLFLDEIGDITPATQVKLLRAIQEKVITRVGENIERKVDIRLVTATNRNLRKMVKEEKFREDLFFRLNVFPINTVPLRDRGSDIFLITNYLIEKFNTKYGRFVNGISRKAMEIMVNYPWPGNVRELENTIEHAFVLRREGEIDVDDLPKEIVYTNVSVPLIMKDSDIARKNKYARVPIKKEELEELLEQYGQSRKMVAEHLGISTVALWKKMKKFGMLEND
jgi:transcriptional regulator with PAS, ATPase and Fis domain